MRKKKYALAGPVKPPVPKVPTRTLLPVSANYIPILPPVAGTREEARTNRAIQNLYQRNNPAYKELLNRKESKQRGGQIGGAIGTSAAMVIPGAQPFAPLLGAAGSMIGNLFGGKPEEPKPPATVGKVFSPSYGFAKGGKVNKKGNYGATMLKQNGGGVKSRPIQSTVQSRPIQGTVQSRPVRSTVQPMPVQGTVQSRPVRTTARTSAIRPVQTTSTGPRTTVRQYASGGNLVIPPEVHIVGVAGDGTDEAVPSRRRKSYMAGGMVSPRYAMGGEITDLVESQEGVFIEGPSHEAGGVDLGPLGRPDIEVEGNEAIAMEGDQPEYVFSDIKIAGKNRTFAQEYERLLDKGDFKKIEELKMDQERQMGRVTDVTVPKLTRQATFAKYGGKIQMPTGGNPPRFMGPGVGTHTMMPPNVPPGPQFMPPGSGPHSMVPPRGPVPTGPQFMPPGSGTHTMLPAHSTGPMPQTPAAGWRKPLGHLGRGLGRAAGGVGMLLASPETVGNPGIDHSYLNEFDWTAPGAPDKPVVPNEAPSAYIDENLSIPVNSWQGVAPIPEAGYQPSPIGRGSVPAESFSSPGVTPPSAGAVEGIERPQHIQPGQPGGSMNWGRALDIAGQVAPYAADMFNIITARNMPLPKTPRGFTPALMDDRVSTVAQEADIQRGVRSITADPTASQGQRLAALSQGFQARGGVRDQANQRRDQIRRSNVAMINQGMLTNMQTQERHQDRLAQARGARATATSQGIRSMSDRLAVRRLEQQAKDMEPMRLATTLAGSPTLVRNAVLESIRDTLPPGQYENVRKMIEQLLANQPEMEAA
jgi:hypothetical protein